MRLYTYSLQVRRKLATKPHNMDLVNDFKFQLIINKCEVSCSDRTLCTYKLGEKLVGLNTTKTSEFV